jgi:hypothetical protein
MTELTKPRPGETVLWMWTRTATLDDLAYCLTADAFVGVTVDRTKHLQIMWCKILARMVCRN